MTTLEIVYNGSITSDAIFTSNTFQNAQFLLFDCPNLPSDQWVEIGFSLSIFVVNISISGILTLQKDVVLPAEEFQGTLTSLSVIDIPREYSESNYQLQCSFNSSINIDSFVVYAVTSSVTQESISSQITDVSSQVTALQTELSSLQAQVTAMQTQVTAIQAQINSIYALIQTLTGALVAI